MCFFKMSGLGTPNMAPLLMTFSPRSTWYPKDISFFDRIAVVRNSVQPGSAYLWKSLLAVTNSRSMVAVSSLMRPAHSLKSFPSLRTIVISKPRPVG